MKIDGKQIKEFLTANHPGGAYCFGSVVKLTDGQGHWLLQDDKYYDLRQFGNVGFAVDWPGTISDPRLVAPDGERPPQPVVILKGPAREVFGADYPVTDPGGRFYLPFPAAFLHWKAPAGPAGEPTPAGQFGVPPLSEWRAKMKLNKQNNRHPLRGPMLRTEYSGSVNQASPGTGNSQRPTTPVVVPPPPPSTCPPLGLSTPSVLARSVASALQVDGQSVGRGQAVSQPDAALWVNR